MLLPVEWGVVTTGKSESAATKKKFATDNFDPSHLLRRPTSPALHQKIGKLVAEKNQPHARFKLTDKFIVIFNGRICINV